MATPDGGRMPLIEHLRELRRRLFKSTLAIMVGFGVGWSFYNPIITKLAEPVCDLKKAQAEGAASCGSLYINGVLGPLNLQIKVALLAGIIMLVFKDNSISNMLTGDSFGRRFQQVERY